MDQRKGGNVQTGKILKAASVGKQVRFLTERKPQKVPRPYRVDEEITNAEITPYESTRIP
jgi:hypothetical protein